MKINTVNGVVTASAESLEDIKLLLSTESHRQIDTLNPPVGTVKDGEKGKWKHRTCGICGKSFMIGGGMARHMSVTHGIKPKLESHLSVNRLQCTACPRSFSSTGGLGHHKAVAHGIRSPKMEMNQRYLINKANGTVRQYVRRQIEPANGWPVRTTAG